MVGRRSPGWDTSDPASALKRVDLPLPGGASEGHDGATGQSGAGPDLCQEIPRATQVRVRQVAVRGFDSLA